MLKSIRTRRAAERLHFVRDDANFVFLCDFNQSLEERSAAWIVAAFSLNQFHPQRRMLARISVDQILEMIYRDLSTSLGIVRFIKRDVVNVERIGQTNTILGLVGDLSQRQRATRETV